MAFFSKACHNNAQGAHPPRPTAPSVPQPVATSRLVDTSTKSSRPRLLARRCGRANDVQAEGGSRPRTPQATSDGASCGRDRPPQAATRQNKTYIAICRLQGSQRVKREQAERRETPCWDPTSVPTHWGLIKRAFARLLRMSALRKQRQPRFLWAQMPKEGLAAPQAPTCDAAWTAQTARAPSRPSTTPTAALSQTCDMARRCSPSLSAAELGTMDSLRGSQPAVASLSLPPG